MSRYFPEPNSAFILKGDAGVTARLIRLVGIRHRVSGGECIGVSGRSPDQDWKEQIAKGRVADIAI